MNRKRWILVIAAAAIIVALVVYNLMPAPAGVDLAQVSRGPLSVSVDEEGKARVRDRFVLSAPVAGYLWRIDLLVGDPVRPGQVLAELEAGRPADLDARSRASAEAAVAAAEASLGAAVQRFEAARAAADYAAANSARILSLFNLGYVARDEAERAKADADRAEALRLSAEADVRAARADLQRARASIGFAGAPPSGGKAVPVVSPRSGRVLKLHRKSEGTVAAGDPLIDIGDTARLEVYAEVLTAEAVKIEPGMPVAIERWGGGAGLRGTVRTIEPQAFTKVSSLGVEEQRVLVVVDITSPTEEWQRLGDEYRVDCRFIVWEGEDVLQVPASSLFRRGDAWAVFTVRNGRAQERVVTVGRQNGLASQIVSGLGAGEAVILHPSESVRDGARVKPR